MTEEFRESFSKINKNHQLAWDNTSLIALKKCPRYYQYSILEGYASGGENTHFRWGSEYNNALVMYNQAIADGMTKDEATASAVAYALEHTWDFELDRPWVSTMPMKTRETLVRSIIWYLDKYYDDPIETQVLETGKSAVELSCRVDIDLTSELTGESYLLCGYVDRKGSFMGSSWVTDWKSTKSALDEKYFESYSPNNQVSQYSFIMNILDDEPVKGVIIDAVQLGVSYSRFQRGLIPRTPSVLEEWFRDAVYYIRLNEKFLEANYWPQNDTACTKLGGCHFKEVCSKSPAIRLILLKASFDQTGIENAYNPFWDRSDR